MSRREDIDNSIWQDAEFDALSNDAQLLYLWSFTNPRCGMAGIYKVAERQVLEGRLAKQALAKALAELAEHRFAFYHEGVLWVRSRVRHLRTHTQQIARSVLTDLERVGLGHPLAIAFCEENRGGWLEAHATLPRTSPEVQQSPEVSQFLNLTRPSTEVRPNLQGQGQGKGTGKRDRTVGRARVTDEEHDLATAIVAAFNEAAGSSYTVDAHLTPVVGRIREHPELLAGDHERIIAANFAAPWWSDRPGVEVIYGNARAFERAMERGKARAPRRVMPHLVEAGEAVA